MACEQEDIEHFHDFYDKCSISFFEERYYSLVKIGIFFFIRDERDEKLNFGSYYVAVKNVILNH